MPSLTLIFALCALIISVSCSTPPSFCKCTCFTNSTIIELTPPTDSTTQSFLFPRVGGSQAEAEQAEAEPNPFASLFTASGAGKIRHGPKPHSPNIGSTNAPRVLSNLFSKTPSAPKLDRRSSTPPSLHLRAPPAACTRCNRAFCLSQNLPICKGAEEKDIQTSCFQRDSRKDQVVVLGFIAVTVGLLGWAGGREALARSRRNREAGAYAPLNR